MSSKVKVKGKRLIKNSAMFGNIWGWNANLPGEVWSAFAQIMFPLNTNFLLPLVNPETVRLQTGYMDICFCFWCWLCFLLYLLFVVDTLASPPLFLPLQLSSRGHGAWDPEVCKKIHNNFLEQDFILSDGQLGIGTHLFCKQTIESTNGGQIQE